MPHSNRFKLSLAGTAAVALASLPLAVTPASAARVSEGTTSGIGVVETSSNASQFHLKTQSASTVLVARSSGTAVGVAADGGGRTFAVPAFLQQLLEFFGIQTTKYDDTKNHQP
jgi:hypothetical protein